MFFENEHVYNSVKICFDTTHFQSGGYGPGKTNDTREKTPKKLSYFGLLKSEKYVIILLPQMHPR